MFRLQRRNVNLSVREIKFITVVIPSLSVKPLFLFVCRTISTSVAPDWLSELVLLQDRALLGDALIIQTNPRQRLASAR